MVQRGTKHTKHSIKKIKQNISQKEITENDKVSKTLVEGEEFKKFKKQAQ